MGREAHALLAGLFVVGLGIAAVVIGVWLGNVGAEYDAYVVVSRYPVSGLRPESTVFYRGVEIGKVTRIEVAPEDIETIRVPIQVTKGFPVTDHTYARLRVQPLTGLAQIELDNTPGLAKRLVTSPEAPAVIPMHPSLFEQLTGTGQDLMSELQRLVMRVNEVFDDENRRLLHRILQDLESATAGLVRLEEEMASALAEVPKVSTSAQKTMARIEALSAELEALSRQAGTTLAAGRDLLATGKRLGATLDNDTLPRFHALLEEMQAVSLSVQNLSERLEQDPRTILLGPPPPEPGPGESGYRNSGR